MDYKHVYNEDGTLEFIRNSSISNWLTDALRFYKCKESALFQIIKYANNIQYYWSTSKSLDPDAEVNFLNVKADDNIPYEIRMIVIDIFKDYIEQKFLPSEFILVMYHYIIISLWNIESSD
ncbi:MAG: hypothetical protein KatS3mg002_0408 [Candidatus Woesearchaeota archaeon]|nr:MAG: hypothetical protein KatS3mg002_0408 [Candidatus Woesearchaeota archaeon]